MFMKSKHFLAAITLVAALALPANSAPTAQAGQVGNKAEKGEREGKEAHPVIERAIRQLEQVKKELETQAAHDFKGHRVAAIKSIDEALHHLHEALEADKK